MSLTIGGRCVGRRMVRQRFGACGSGLRGVRRRRRARWVAGALGGRAAEVAVTPLDDDLGTGAVGVLGGVARPNGGLKDAAGRHRQTNDKVADHDQCDNHAHQPDQPELFFGHGNDSSAARHTAARLASVYGGFGYDK